MLKLFFAAASLLNAALLFAGDKPNTAAPRQVAANVGRLLELGHYSGWKLGPEMSERILETYLEDLDSDKVFLTQNDVNRLSARYGTTIGRAVLLGNLGPAGWQWLRRQLQKGEFSSLKEIATASLLRPRLPFTLPQQASEARAKGTTGVHKTRQLAGIKETADFSAFRLVRFDNEKSFPHTGIVLVAHRAGARTLVERR